MTAPGLLYDSGASGRQGSRRMLLVSCLFSPSTEIGAQRWHHLSRFAAERGWEIDVIMIDASSGAQRDETLLRQLPPGVRLYAVSASPPFLWNCVVETVRVAGRIRKRLKWHPRGRVSGSDTDEGAAGAATISRNPSRFSRAAMRFANAHLYFTQAALWIERATAVGRTLCGVQEYDLVVSSGPPHQAHVAASRIAAGASLPLVADLRDAIALPEVEPDDMRGRHWRARAGDWERTCLSEAALIVANTEHLRERLSFRYPAARDRILTVMNGADSEFRLTPIATREFVIAHTGSIYAGRDPRSLFLAVAEVIRRRALRPDQIRLHFMGETSFEGTPLSLIAENAGIASYVTLEPVRGRAAVRELLARSAILAVLPQTIPYAIPAKIFEYVQAPAWILALTQPGSSVAQLLAGTSADVVAPEDVAQIAARVEHRLVAFMGGERPIPLNADGRFDRSHQASVLFKALDTIVPPRAATLAVP